MGAGRLAAAEVGLGPLHGGALLGAHGKALGAPSLVVLAVAHLEPGVAHVVDRAAEPLAAQALDAVADQAPVDVVVREDVPSSRMAGSEKTISYGLPSPLGHRELLGHAPLDVNTRSSVP